MIRNLVKNVLAVLGAGLLLGVSIFLIAPTPPKEVKIDATALSAAKGDYAAIGFFDCNELIAVTFLSFEGEFQLVPIRSPAHLLDIQLRMSHVDYDRVQYMQNPRPCGLDLSKSDIVQ